MPDKWDAQAAIADLRAEHTRIQEVTDRMKSVTGSASSKDRMVTATVDGQGRLVDLTLAGNRYRQLAPGELASRIVATIRSAQDDAVRTTTGLLNEVLPPGLGLPVGGDLDLDAMFDAAVASISGSEDDDGR
jgi:DNA-binding protein YbaB